MKNKKQISETPIPSINKGLIFLKSSVIALGLVFLVLLVLLLILKTHENETPKIAENSCNKEQIIDLNNEIDEIIDGKSEIIILTEPKASQQQLLILDKNCGVVKQKIQFNLK